MKRFLQHQRCTTRRGAVLIVVLAMLALFAVIGLSFVLYAESQANMAESNKRSFSDNTSTEGFLDAQPEKSAELFISNLLYGLQPTGDDLMNPLRGHSLADSKYGAFRVGFEGQPSLFPFSGSPFPAETINIPGLGPIDRRQVLNYTYQRGVNPVDSYVVDPERIYNGGQLRQGLTAHTDPYPVTSAYWNHAVPYTYPDRQANLFLALQDQTTGEILSPSFYRRDLLPDYDLFNQTQAFLNAQPPAYKTRKLLTLRPTRYDHPNFPPVPPNSDGTITGDVQNMKFLGGTNQKNDSFWMDGGGPVLTLRGRKVKAMIAPLILDLNNKVNLSIAGNIRAVNPAQVPGGARHTSQDGMGPWEINPGLVGINPTAPPMSEPELERVLRKRFVADEASMPPLEGTRLSQTIVPWYSPSGTRDGWINQRQLPPLYSVTSPDGVSSAMAADPMSLPAANGPGVFPNFPNTRFPSNSSASPSTMAERLANHPHLFNPFLNYRGSAQTSATLDRPFGLDDVVTHGARLNDTSNRWRNTSFAAANAAPLSMANLSTRLMTTGFSASQQLPALPIRIGTGQFDYANLAPIDINRDLFDYRKNVQIPLSPVNNWAYDSATNTFDYTNVNYLKARQARQTLARDIFVRLAALATFDDSSTAGTEYNAVVDGDKVRYDPSTAYLIITLDPAVQIELDRLRTLRDMAQLAANMVDLIDHDDIATAFVWNPDRTVASWTDMTVNHTQLLDPSAEPANFNNPTLLQYRAVYGTELPKLVLNEVYNYVANDRLDTFMPMMRAQQPLKRRYVIELHNPMPFDATQPEKYSARLKYQSGVTSLINPVTNMPALYAGTTFNPYQIEIAVNDTAFASGTPAKPYTAALQTDPLLIAADHKVPATAIPGVNLRASINSFNHSPGTPAPASLVAGTDNANFVTPLVGASTPGSNNGFYVIGPHKGATDVFTNIAQSLSTLDPAAGIPNPTTPVDSLSFDATGMPPTGPNITTEAAKTSVILLRRLMNPYVPYNNVTNPYITVDYLENIPTRDRATNDNAGMYTAPAADATRGTLGRTHPYAAAPTFSSGSAFDAVQLHTTTIPGPAVAGQPHNSLFNLNENSQNNRSRDAIVYKGFEWMVHFDRKLINSTELLHVNTVSPALLTQRFAVNNPLFGGANNDAFVYHFHTRANSLATNTLPYLLDTTNQPYLYKALEFLTCGNLLPNTPIGWRETGKMNVNGFTRENLFQAVADAQPTNKFTIANVTNSWGNLLNTRSPGNPTAMPSIPVGTPRSTIAESNLPGDDRPIQSFSAASGRDETIWRSGSLQPIPPLNYTDDHPYTNYELLRKTWNSMNTVSDSFLLIMTVSFFEVENDTTYSVTSPPILGKEVFSVTPDDLRVQFAGILDRSNLVMSKAVTADSFVFDPAAPLLDTDPWMLKVVEDVYPGATSIHVEGRLLSPNIMRINRLGGPFGISPSTTTTYRLGHGAIAPGPGGENGDGEVIRIKMPNNPEPSTIFQRQLPDASGTLQNVPEQVTIIIDTDPTKQITRFHAAGSPFSAFIPGNPGPQAVKPTLLQLSQRQLVPYFTRLNP